MQILCECPLWEQCKCGREHKVRFGTGVTRAAIYAVDDDEETLS